MIAAVDNVDFFVNKAGGCQEFLYGKMCELYYFSRRIFVDNGKKTGAR